MNDHPIIAGQGDETDLHLKATEHVNGWTPKKRSAENPAPEPGRHKIPLRSIKGGVMRYQITGKQIDIGEALQTHVMNELASVVEKYAERPTDAQVIFSRNAHEYVCEATVHLSTGLSAQAKAHANEIYAAFDACGEKMEKQLRRYKRRLKDHHKERSEPVELSGAASYILASGEDTDESEPETLQPMIIAEMETNIPSLSVGEAVMQMEIAGAPVLVFRNEGTNGVNVVYRREDGNIGWIDPRNAA